MSLHKVFASALVFASVAVAAPAQDRSPAPEDARAYIVAPEDGATVASPVTVRFGLQGMGVAPAGVDNAMTGHHHLLIDVDPDTVDYSQGVPADDNHIHFGGGQTEVTLDMDPGTYTLWLLLGDANHIPHDPPVRSEPITITVE
ncbi:DUF4399 domain-containing protein [Rhodovulum adriaticum]|uniref:Uncharacterized protein DUF4399 n=1 Tax=Rhodovulum adriaticum TaxID=35804 RepID=A0A4R2NIV4_RHOAD|nr:DUF4399 domain-containing protein [Rhodovulum adriaticum]MBK1635891.1 rod shape-determining protein RodA [Rhodovulum adriaticum]TCP21433.1 uncharacterized protein DUF4399 [Rhodovulum adriaticum]